HPRHRTTGADPEHPGRRRRCLKCRVGDIQVPARIKAQPGQEPSADVEAGHQLLLPARGYLHPLAVVVERGVQVAVAIERERLREVVASERRNDRERGRSGLGAHDRPGRLRRGRRYRGADDRGHGGPGHDDASREDGSEHVVAFFLYLEGGWGSALAGPLPGCWVRDAAGGLWSCLLSGETWSALSVRCQKARASATARFPSERGRPGGAGTG